MARESRRDASDQFARYVADCRILRRDYLNAIRDLQFEQGGGNLRYAVDFSEVFSYVLPGAAAAGFVLAFQGEPALAPLVEARALQYLFAPASRRVLLSPYAVELAAFYRRRSESQHRHYVDAIGGAFAAADAARNDPDFQVITVIYDRWRASGVAPTDSERRRALAFVQKYAHHLLALHTIDDHPLTRLRGLVEEGVLVGVDEILGPEFDGEVSQLTVQRWFEGLVKQRPSDRRSASHLDALAVAEVERANEILGRQKTRLLLVTRSPHMHAFLDEIAQVGGPLMPVADLLRHPRVFLLFANTRNLETSERINHFAKRVEGLQAFLDLVDLRVRNGRVGHGTTVPDSGFTALFSALQSDWEAREGREAFAGASGDPSELRVEQADALFELLRNDSLLQQMVKQRIDEFDQWLARGQETILLYVEGRALGSSATKGLAATQIRGVPALRATSQSLPYSFAFRSSGARRLMSRLRAAGDVTWSEIVDVLREQIASDVDAEWFFVMGFLFGVLQNWEVAETFARRASHARQQEGTLDPDTCLFLAFCLRKHRRTLERHVEAIDLLRRAIRVADEEVGAEGLTRARLRKELAVHLLRLETYPDGVRTAQERGWSQDPLVLLEEAQNLAGDDPDLRVQIVNNRVYAAVALGKPMPEATLREELRLLLLLQRQLEPHEDRWPPFLLDTVAWATWKLNGRKSVRNVRTWLTHALASREPVQEERERIQEHLAEIEREVSGPAQRGK